MNILFLTLLEFNSFNERNIYSDLLREFKKNGHNIYAISPIERREKIKTKIIKEDNSKILRLKIGNIQKTNIIEKGISTLNVEPQYIKGIKKYFSDIQFDLVLYSTPPITFCKAINYVKKRDNAKTYLLLKDIFPQNAIDIGILSKKGFKGLIYRFFRRKEKQLYGLSDYIGCMSNANKEYILMHNRELNKNKIEICPNSVEVEDKTILNDNRINLRKKYNIPVDRKIFIYGGNLGKPQGIDFLINCLDAQKDNEKIFFLIVGNGTEYYKIDQFIKNKEPKNVRLMSKLEKNDYERIVGVCDIGMIFLDYRFTIPNFPSRLLSYMQARIPVLACTDDNTDIGEIIVSEKFGWWCKSNNIDDFNNTIDKIIDSNVEMMKQNEWNYLIDNYTTENSYKIIMKHFYKEGEQ